MNYFLMEFQEKLVGERLVLKRNVPNMELAKTMFQIIDANRKHLGKWLPWERFTLKIEDSMKYLVDTEKKINNKEKIDYGIYLEGKYMGNIGLFDLDEKKKSGEIGYWITSELSGKGYASEAVKILEKEGFENLGLNRIQIKCDERNKPSAKVAEKCGYQFEGKIREDDFSEFFKDFRNTLLFSKLKSEY
jgi:ribosomal-protein-serine acetyltransferase